MNSEELLQTMQAILAKSEADRAWDLFAASALQANLDHSHRSTSYERGAAIAEACRIADLMLEKRTARKLKFPDLNARPSGYDDAGFPL